MNEGKIAAVCAAAMLAGCASSPSGGGAADRRVEAHLERAGSYFGTQDYPAAVREYDAAIALVGPTERLLSLRAGARFRSGNFRAAEEDLSLALEHNPGDAELVLLRGLARSLLSPPDRRGTCEDFERARQLGRDLREMVSGIDEWCASAR